MLAGASTSIIVASLVRLAPQHVSRAVGSPRCSPSRGCAFDDSELRRRLADLAASEEAEQLAALSQLQTRMTDIALADARERELYDAGSGMLPVVCLDAMLPRQIMKVDTEDPTFCRLLRDVGLGGLFVVTSLNFEQRRVRRSGVVVRVALVDAQRERESDPTAVSALLVGRRRVRIGGGTPQGLRLRIGRFRRGYDDFTSELALGWGMEPFVDRVADATPPSPPTTPPPPGLPHTEWTLTAFDVLTEATESALYDAGTACEVQLPGAASGDDDFDALRPAAEALAEALMHWLALARDPRTYDNVDVTAGARARHGEPGLRLDPDALLARVLDDLGPRPQPSAPMALALWGAALINPLPSLGVATEVRGAVLEAACAADCVALVRRAVDRSIQNLEGRKPLI